MPPPHLRRGSEPGAEAYELTRAVNAGCGFTCTVHANSAREALSALVENSLKAGENIPASVARRSFALHALDAAPGARAHR